MGIERPILRFNLVSFFLVVFCATVVHSFDFQVDTPRQCDDLTVTWSGGTPPFTLTAVAPGANNLNFNIPSSAFQNNNGTFKTPLPVAKNTQLLFAMGDATDPLGGGTSKVLVVGNSLTGSNCNTTLPANDFFYSADDTPSECKPYSFTQFSNATLPITLSFYVPDGHDSFVITPPSSDSFTWNTNLTAQTQFITTITDSKKGRGGTDIIKTVTPSNDQSCVHASNPSSSQTPTPTPASKGASKGVIIGIVVAAVAILILIGTVIWLLKRRKRSHNAVLDLTGGQTGFTTQHSGSDVASSQPMLANHFIPTPYPVNAINEQHPPSSYVTSYPPSSSSRSGLSDPTSKAGSSSTRYVVHRDIEDEVEELPPQYSDRRAPIEGLVPGASQESGPTSSTPARSRSMRKG